MSVVLRIVQLADGRPTPVEGRYVVECDVDFMYGVGRVDTTEDKAKARVFEGVAEALTYWKRQSTVVPLRLDGKPNRPLTAYTVEVEPV